MEKKTKLIFNRKIALKLSRLGFPIIDIVESRNKEYIEIYVFENTETFKQTFTDIVNAKETNTKRYNSNRSENSNANNITRPYKCV